MAAIQQESSILILKWCVTPFEPYQVARQKLDIDTLWLILNEQSSMYIFFLNADNCKKAISVVKGGLGDDLTVMRVPRRTIPALMQALLFSTSRSLVKECI